MTLFDSVESNFEIRSNNAANLSAFSDQKFPFEIYIKEKFVSMLQFFWKYFEYVNKFKLNFLLKTPIHVLESEIFSTSQKFDETVREFGTQSANLENSIVNCIVDEGEWPIRKKNLKIAEISSKIKKQFVDGLRHGLFIYTC